METQVTAPNGRGGMYRLEIGDNYVDVTQIPPIAGNVDVRENSDATELEVFIGETRFTDEHSLQQFATEVTAASAAFSQFKSIVSSVREL